MGYFLGADFAFHREPELKSKKRFSTAKNRRRMIKQSRRRNRNVSR